MGKAIALLLISLSIAIPACGERSTRVKRAVGPSASREPQGQSILAAAPPPLNQFVQLELIRSPIGGDGKAVRLNHRLKRDDDVMLFEISPDSKRVVYVVNGTDRPGDLYSCEMSGGSTPILLNPTAKIRDAFSVTPDSQYVVWMDTGGELYSRPIDGRAESVHLGGPCQPGFFSLSNDSQWIVYLSGGKVYRQHVAGSGQPIALNEHATEPGSADLFKISPDSQWVVYRQSIERDGSIATGVFRRHIEATDAPKLMSGTLDASSTEIDISLDSSTVVFRARPDTERYNLYRVSLDGGEIACLNDSVESIGGGTPYRCQISSNSQFVIFQAGEKHSLYSCPLGGGGGPVLLARQSYIRYFALSPDGTQVVYLSKLDDELKRREDLCSRAIDGSGPVNRLNRNLPAEGFVWVEFLISQDSNKVLFRATPKLAEQGYGLYVNEMAGEMNETEVVKAGSNSGGVDSFRFVDNGSLVAFTSRPNEQSETQIWISDIKGQAKPRPVSQLYGQDGGCIHFSVSPDRRYVVYLGYRVTPELKERRKPDGEGVSSIGFHIPIRDFQRYGNSVR